MFETRVNLSELHEQPWFPRSLRDDVTDELQFILNAARIYRPIVKHLRKAIKITGTSRLLDLCSGGGGPWVWLHRALGRQATGHLEICLTDKFPNIAAFRCAREHSQGAIVYCGQPVNAAKIPQELSGFRTLFTSFHHFSPAEAAALLQDAVNNRQGIGIFEVPKRCISGIALTFLMPLAALLAAPFIRPFRMSLLIWTYLIPVIPLVLLFDGILSCLRAYSPSELSGIIRRLNADCYIWEVGEERGWLAPVTYLLGYPTPSRDDSLPNSGIKLSDTLPVELQSAAQSFQEFHQ
jgi:hypothetical protein